MKGHTGLKAFTSLPGLQVFSWASEDTNRPQGLIALTGLHAFIWDTNRPKGQASLSWDEGTYRPKGLTSPPGNPKIKIRFKIRVTTLYFRT